MAVNRAGNVIRMTEDNDTVVVSGTGFRISGARLISGSDASSALIKATDTDGKVLISLKADPTIQGADEMAIPFRCDVTTLHLDLTGTGAEVFIYLE